MGSITTAAPTSFKQELPRAIHDFTQTTGNDFKAALIKPSPAGTFGAGTTNYSALGSDEVTGTGYTAGGYDWGSAANITPTIFGTEVGLSWNANPNWVGATFQTAGVIFYNNTQSGRAIYVGTFGGTFTVTGGSFAVLLPPNGAGTSVLALV